MGQFLRWKRDRGFTTDAQALSALLQLFFSGDLAGASTLPTALSQDRVQMQAQITHLQVANENLEAGQTELKQESLSHQPLVSGARMQSLEQEVAQLRQVIQRGQGLINDRLAVLAARIQRLEGPAAGTTPVNHDDLPDDEPDEILTDFLEPS